MAFTRMVDMTRTPEEKAEERARDVFPQAVADMPDIPPGLSLAFTEDELAKLGLDDDVEVGDMLHVSGMLRVTSVSKNETDSGCRIRIEAGFCLLAIEDESTEATDKGLEER